MPGAVNSQSNSVSFSSQGTQPSSFQKDSQTPQSLTREIAIEQLKQSTPTAAEEAPSLDSKTIETPAPGVWGSIVKFFNRQFSTITESEYDQAKQISLLIGQIELELNKMTQLAKKVAYAERALSGKLPTEKTVSANEAYLKEGRKLLDKATVELEKLIKQESIAQQLADNHATFDHFLTDIERLKKNIQYLETRCQVLEKLLDLEKLMKDYSVDQTWDQFVEIRQRREDLTQALKTIFSDNQVLVEDLQAQSYMQETSTSEQIYFLVKNTFPGLKGYIERLLNSTLTIHQSRIEKLYQEVRTLKPLFSKYKDLSNRISSLDYAIHDNSIISRIYRVFHSKEKLRKQLQHLQNEQKATFKDIQTKGKFHASEISWMEEQIKGNPSLEDLKQDIIEIQKEMVYLNVRQNIAEQTHQFLTHLEFYHKHKEDEESLGFVDYKKLKETLSSDIQSIAQNVQYWSFKSKDLPKHFTKMDVLDQLTTLISVSFPTLAERNKMISNLINELGLNDALNEAIEQREISGTITIESKVEETKDQQSEKIIKISNQSEEAAFDASEDDESHITPADNQPVIVEKDVSPQSDKNVEKKKYTAIPSILPHSKTTEKPLKEDRSDKSTSKSPIVSITKIIEDESPTKDLIGLNNKPSELSTSAALSNPIESPSEKDEKVADKELEKQPLDEPMLKTNNPPPPPKMPAVKISTLPKTLQKPADKNKQTDVVDQEIVKTQSVALDQLQQGSDEDSKDLVSQIKQGINLNKITDQPVSPHSKTEEKEEVTLLSQIKGGITLKKVNKETNVTPYERIMEQVRLGNLIITPNDFKFKEDADLHPKIKESLEQDWNSFGLTEKLKIQMDVRAIALGNNSGTDEIDEDEDEDNSEWDI